jgi:CDP-glucose 4,6-dehydratase
MKSNNLNYFDGIFKDKKILITGDTGFKGSWLSVWLKLLGAEVYGYSLPPKSEKDNYVRTKLADRINHQNGDVRELETLKLYLKEIQPEIAFHLAAQPLVLESYKNPHYTFETNIMGTVNFLEAVRYSESVKAAVIITSDKCYQNNEWIWGYRENEPMGGDDPYSASKGCAELITSSYIKSFFSNDSAAKIASARAGNVIGGGDWAENRIVPDFFRALERNEKLLLRNPWSTRPWQHVLEPLSGYLLLCSRLYKDDSHFSGGWNFGPMENAQHSVLELIENMISYCGAGSVIFDENKEKLHEANLLKLDISKAVHHLNWKPVLDFKDTVEFTADGYKDELDSSDLFESRINQIQKYTSLARKRNINWAIK